MWGGGKQAILRLLGTVGLGLQGRFSCSCILTHVCLYRSDVCLPVYDGVYDDRKFAWCLPSVSCLTWGSLKGRLGLISCCTTCSLSSNDCPGGAGWECWNKEALCCLADCVIDDGYPWFSVPLCLMFKRPAGWVLTARTAVLCGLSLTVPTCAWALRFPFKFYFL